MKKPDSNSHQAFLRRLLPSAVFQTIIYFEDAVLANDNGSAKGYYIFLVTESHFYYLSPKDTSLPSSQTWSLLSLHAIQMLHDPATFFASPLSEQTKHIRVHVSDQVASRTAVIDFFTFYEDSFLYHHLYHAWVSAHMRNSLPSFYSASRSRLTSLSSLAMSTLYGHYESLLLNVDAPDASQTTNNQAKDNKEQVDEAIASPANANPASSSPSPSPSARRSAVDTWKQKKKKFHDIAYWNVKMKIKYLQELTICVSQHREMKLCAFKGPLLQFLLDELKKLSRYRMFLLGVDPAALWSYLASKQDLLIEDEIANIQYITTILIFYSRLLAGSSCLSDRINFLMPHSNVELPQLLDTLFLLSSIPNLDHAPVNNIQSNMQTNINDTASPAHTSPTLSASQFLHALHLHISRPTPLKDIDELSYSNKYIWNVRSCRRWREECLEEVTKQHKATSSKNKNNEKDKKVEMRDLETFFGSANLVKLFSTSKRKHFSLEDYPRAEEVGFEVVVADNERAVKTGMQLLYGEVQALEVAYMELLYHTVQLLEESVEFSLHPTLSLENLFQHILFSNAHQDFKYLQLPVLYRGMIAMYNQERRVAQSYFTFIYTCVLHRMLVRSNEVKIHMLREGLLDSFMINDDAKKGNTSLLSDIVASPYSAQSKGLFFLQLSKPLMESIIEQLQLSQQSAALSSSSARQLR